HINKLWKVRVDSEMESTILNSFEEAKDTQASRSWTEVIKPHSGWLDIHLIDIWRYRDLIMLLVRRDFVSIYKQTILGPLWIFIQPLLVSFTYVIIFTRVAHLSSDGLPPILFYLAGVTCWNYFSACLNTTASTFVSNAHIFGKVYFPRLAMPLSVSISNLVRFCVQFLLLAILMVCYSFKGVKFQVQSSIFLLPVLLFIMAGLSLGLGIIVSSLTTRYRDLSYLITFGVQLLMYASPVVYPLSSVPKGKLRTFLLANPMSGPIETFKFALFGRGYFSFELLSYDLGLMLLILIVGILVFNKVEKSFMDTV
ncbi:MAG TPA: ABC transporter permease, partial [Candidatus Babeliaceae bacterium]|nr:ABC transporter permease [Candidatus Babeliaceae bacterium]